MKEYDIDVAIEAKYRSIISGLERAILENKKNEDNISKKLDFYDALSNLGNLLDEGKLLDEYYEENRRVDMSSLDRGAIWNIITNNYEPHFRMYASSLLDALNGDTPTLLGARRMNDLIHILTEEDKEKVMTIIEESTNVEIIRKVEDVEHFSEVDVFPVLGINLGNEGFVVTDKASTPAYIFYSDETLNRVVDKLNGSLEIKRNI